MDYAEEGQAVVCIGYCIAADQTKTEKNNEKSATEKTKSESSLKVESEFPTLGDDSIPEVIVPPPSEGTGTAPSVKKTVFAHFPLIKLWFVLILTLGFTVVLLVASHLTHSLTLRIEAYHALYNVLALVGCLFTMKDAMHHPLPVVALGGIGLCLNAIVFCLIGGYTHHQGCFLERRSSGVWVQKVTEEAVQAGMRTLLSHPLKEIAGTTLHRSYEGVRGILRDISGLIVVMLCAAVVYWDKEATLALYVDPAFAMLSAFILMLLSFPYGKECCQILLQTIPGNIDVHSFSAELLEEFPEVVNIHHLHIWSLTPEKVVATAHVVYSNPKVYRNSIDALEKFFREKDITQVTLQPEFVHYSSASPSELGSSECLLRCINDLCRNKECCAGCSSVDEKVLKEGVSSQSVSETRTPCSLGICHESDSRKLSIRSEHHGTSAFRNSKDFSTQMKFPSRRSRSKEDLSKNTAPSPKISRSYSFHLTSRPMVQAECFDISEKK